MMLFETEQAACSRGFLLAVLAAVQSHLQSYNVQMHLTDITGSGMRESLGDALRREKTALPACHC